MYMITTTTLSTPDVLTASIPLADDAPAVCDDVRIYIAALRELVQAVNAGTITATQRAELGGQLLAQADVLTDYAIRVLA